MYIYYGVYVLIISLYFLSTRTSRVVSIVARSSSFLVVAIFSGMRGSVGQDTASYTVHFEKLTDIEKMLLYFSQVEALFAMLMVITKLAIDNVNVFFLIVSFLQALLLFYILKRVKHPVLFLCIYLLVFYTSFHFNTLRAGLAALFFLSSLVSRDSKKKSFFLLVLSVLSHLSILIFLPIYLVRMNVSTKYYIRVFVSSLIFGMFIIYFFADLIAFKFDAYLSSGVNLESAPMTFVLFSLIGYFLFTISKDLSKELYLSFVIFSLFWISALQIQIMYRLYILGAIIFFLLALEKKMYFKLTFKPLFAYILLLGLFFSYLTYMGMVNEHHKVVSTGKGDPDFTLLPYTTFLND